MRWWLLLVSATACGRIGIDERRSSADAATDDAIADAWVDMGNIDAPGDMAITLACPADMTRLSTTSTACIELDDRGAMLWQVGKDLCEAQGRRYCTDAEWLEGCVNAVGLVDITGDNYEWVAEEAGGTAQKRGSSACTDASSHVITDPYEVRCCGPML